MIGVIITAFKAGMAILKGAKLLKYVSPAVAVLSLGKDYFLKYWKLALIIVLAVVLVAGNWWKEREISKHEATITALQTSSADYARALVTNERAIDNCIAVNRANHEQYVLAEIRAGNLIISLEEQLKQSNQKVEIIYEDISDLRGKDETCRTLDEPLPDWFDEWLRE